MKQNKPVWLMAGFVAGMMYVVACGTTGQSIAAAIGNAIDVVFDSTTSALTATNVQAAIDEVVSRVKDLESTSDTSSLLIGTWTGHQKLYNSAYSDTSGEEGHGSLTLTLNADGSYSCSIQDGYTDSTTFGQQNALWRCDSECRIWSLFGKTLELHYLYDSVGVACTINQGSNSTWVRFPIQMLDASNLQLLSNSSGDESAIMLFER